MTEEELYPQLHSILKQYFHYDRMFILHRYGVGLDNLLNDLKPLCKHSYDNNYRFVFLHFDTDYHITNDQPGLVMRNLQRILKELDISNYFCMVVSQKDLQKDLDLLRVQETTDCCSIYNLLYPIEDLYHYHDDEFDIESNPTNVRHKYICLNRVKRKHRTILYALFKAKNLLNKGLVSYGAKS